MIAHVGTHSELGRIDVGHYWLDDDDGAARGDTTVPPGRDAHDLAVTLDNLMRYEEIEHRLGGGIVQITLAIVGRPSAMLTSTAPSTCPRRWASNSQPASSRQAS